MSTIFTAEIAGAIVAGTERAEIVVAVDAGGMAIVEGDLDGIVPYRVGGLSARLGLVHGEKRGGGSGGRASGFLFGAFVIAGGAGAMVTEEGKVKVAGMAVGPGDVDAGAGFDVNLYGGGLLAGIERRRHDA